jgi:ABC-2 type transport system permease protein
VGVLAWRDLTSLLRSPFTYWAIALLVLVVSLFGFAGQVTAGGPVSMAGVLPWVVNALVVLVPLLTMRLLTREARDGTLDQLLASPVRPWELVVGKWLAGLVLVAAAAVPTLVYVLLIAAAQPAGSPGVDSGAVLAGYLGLLLVGAAWVALGLLAASVVDSQIAAAAIGVAALAVLQFVLGAVAGLVHPPLADLIAYAGAAEHARSFDQGRIVLRDMVYFVTLTGAALAAAGRVVESRRWR